jgi:hypothetical protein
VILVVHLAQQHGLELCPNYVIAEHRLQLGERGLFTAHELAQIIPLHGIQLYERMMESNSWIADYLPNVMPRSAGAAKMGSSAQRGRRLMETMLAGGLGDMLERWESGRKIPRLRRMAEQRGAAGAIFTPDLCKGHMDDHTDDVRRRFAEGLAAQGIEPNPAWVRP